jgi:CDP-diacylglycerol---serine O-phosphatidyltransferase
MSKMVRQSSQSSDSILKIVKLPDLFTLAGALSGLGSIFCSIQNQFGAAAALMTVAVSFDFLDGRIARMLRVESEFGKILDSLSDIISFGIAPVIFAYCQGLDDVLSITVLGFFICCGILRLARFNVIQSHGFVGVPITINGLVFPMIYVLFPFNKLMLLVYAAMGLLMVSRINIPKV